MKAILEFNLPEDAIEYNHARKGTDYRLALWDINNKLRSITKYYDPQYAPPEGEQWDLKSVEQVRDLFFKVCEEYNIRIHEEYED